MAKFEEILNVALPALVGLGSALDPYGNVAKGAQSAWSMRRAIRGDEEDRAYREFQQERAQLADERAKTQLDLSIESSRRAGRAEQRTIDQQAATIEWVNGLIQSNPQLAEQIGQFTQDAPAYIAGNIGSSLASQAVRDSRPRGLSPEQAAQVEPVPGRSQSIPVQYGEGVGGTMYVGDPTSGSSGTLTDPTTSTRMDAAVKAFDSSVASLSRQQRQAIQQQEQIMNDPALEADPDEKRKRLEKLKDPGYFDIKKNEAYQELVTKAGAIGVSPEEVDAFLAQRQQGQGRFIEEPGTEPPPETMPGSDKPVSTVGREQDVLMGGEQQQPQENPDKQRIYEELKRKLGGKD
jgi:hypothetical protein